MIRPDRVALVGIALLMVLTLPVASHPSVPFPPNASPLHLGLATPSRIHPDTGGITVGNVTRAVLGSGTSFQINLTVGPQSGILVFAAAQTISNPIGSISDGTDAWESVSGSNQIASHQLDSVIWATYRASDSASNVPAGARTITVTTNGAVLQMTLVAMEIVGSGSHGYIYYDTSTYGVTNFGPASSISSATLSGGIQGEPLFQNNPATLSMMYVQEVGNATMTPSTGTVVANQLNSSGVQYLSIVTIPSPSKFWQRLTETFTYGANVNGNGHVLSLYSITPLPAPSPYSGNPKVGGSEPVYVSGTISGTTISYAPIYATSVPAGSVLVVLIGVDQSGSKGNATTSLKDSLGDTWVDRGRAASTDSPSLPSNTLFVWTALVSTGGNDIVSANVTWNAPSPFYTPGGSSLDFVEVIGSGHLTVGTFAGGGGKTGIGGSSLTLSVGGPTYAAVDGMSMDSQAAGGEAITFTPSGNYHALDAAARSSSYFLQPASVNSSTSLRAGINWTNATSSDTWAMGGVPILPPPGPPTNLQVFRVNDSSVGLTWNNPIGTLLNNTVYYKLHSAPASAYAGISTVSAVQYWNVTGLRASTTYDFYVTVWYSSGQSAPSNYVTATTTGPGGNGTWGGSGIGIGGIGTSVPCGPRVVGSVPPVLTEKPTLAALTASSGVSGTNAYVQTACSVQKIETVWVTGLYETYWDNVTPLASLGDLISNVTYVNASGTCEMYYCLPHNLICDSSNMTYVPAPYFVLDRPCSKLGIGYYGALPLGRGLDWINFTITRQDAYLSTVQTHWYAPTNGSNAATPNLTILFSRQFHNTIEVVSGSLLNISTFFSVAVSWVIPYPRGDWDPKTTQIVYTNISQTVVVFAQLKTNIILQYDEIPSGSQNYTITVFGTPGLYGTGYGNLTTPCCITLLLDNVTGTSNGTYQQTGVWTNMLTEPFSGQVTITGSWVALATVFQVKVNSSPVAFSWQSSGIVIAPNEIDVLNGSVITVTVTYAERSNFGFTNPLGFLNNIPLTYVGVLLLVGVAIAIIIAVLHLGKRIRLKQALTLVAGVLLTTAWIAVLIGLGGGLP